MREPPLPSLRDGRQEMPADTAEAIYDTLWSTSEIPTRAPEGIERVMLAEDKLYVVLAVVLIIWFGLIFFLLRTDRRLDTLEREVEDRISDDQSPA